MAASTEGRPSGGELSQGAANQSHEPLQRQVPGDAVSRNGRKNHRITIRSVCRPRNKAEFVGPGGATRYKTEALVQVDNKFVPRGSPAREVVVMAQVFIYSVISSSQNLV